MTRVPNPRRDALVLGASMMAAAALAAVVKPLRTAAPDPAPIALDALFPRQFGEWREDDANKAFVRPPELQGKVYGLYDQVLERIFVNPRAQRVMLSVAYGGDQSTSFQLHRPEGCYESAGFVVDDVHSEALVIAGNNVTVTRMRSAMPDRAEPVTYWTVLGGEVAANRVAFRLRRIFSGLRGRTLTGLLVRISSIDEDTPRAYALQARFADAMVGAMSPEAQQTVLGRAV